MLKAFHSTWTTSTPSTRASHGSEIVWFAVSWELTFSGLRIEFCGVVVVVSGKV